MTPTCPHFLLDGKCGYGGSCILTAEIPISACEPYVRYLREQGHDVEKMMAEGWDVIG